MRIFQTVFLFYCIWLKLLLWSPPSVIEKLPVSDDSDGSSCGALLMQMHIAKWWEHQLQMKGLTACSMWSPQISRAVIFPPWLEKSTQHKRGKGEILSPKWGMLYSRCNFSPTSSVASDVIGTLWPRTSKVLGLHWTCCLHKNSQNPESV